MPNPLSNKKKIRGWKQQLRNLEQWRQAQRVPNLPALETYGETYVKIWLDPWHRLVRRDPPPWFRRKIATALLALYRDWQQALLQRGKPFRLLLYLHEPNFINSQLVAGKPHLATYHPPDPAQPPFPAERFFAPGTAPQDITWQPLIEEDLFLEKLDELTPETIARIKKRAYHISTISSGDTCYHIRTGSAWVGEQTGG